MHDVAIRVVGLSKQYRIGGKQEKYTTFRDTLANVVTAPFKRVGNVIRGSASAASNLTKEFWALQDVNFEIKNGEVTGIIGRNGAGKSTLLKILSSITDPTTGRIELYGRVGALLEVGTGFHQELTGRENIYLNGAILGMGRREIDRKFDEIVAFAEVEDFIDTPVKHYSTGMGLRLGFAVAAHLEPDILIVDEVLAVGDAAFQRKCLGKIGEVAGSGRTVLFVSHNMGAVSKLCQNAIVLDHGKVVYRGNVESSLSYYSQMIRSARSGDDETEFKGDIAITKLNADEENYDPTQPLDLRFEIAAACPFWDFKYHLIMRDSNEVLLFCEEITSSTFPDLKSSGNYHVKVQLPPMWLRSGQYTCYVKFIGNTGNKTVRFTSDPLLLTVMRNDIRQNEYSDVFSLNGQWSVTAEETTSQAANS